MKPIKVIMIGAGQRGNAYAYHAGEFPQDITFVGVAEPHAQRRERFSTKYNIPEENQLYTWEDVFTREKWADAVMICTQDDMHYAPAMAAIEAGYDILLEKPVAPTQQECEDIARAANEKGVKVVVCHVMRYTPFCREIKKIIDSGELGEIVTIVHNENVGNIHQSHSFVRGNWRNSYESSPMILAKSCHDMDMLQWFVGKKCERLSSFGSLSYFNEKNCPPEAPNRCADGCTVDCPYDSRKLYNSDASDWFKFAVSNKPDPTDEEMAEALAASPYGKCVYKCDNNVVDHQVVSLEYEGGVTVLFSMSAFTPDISRSIKIMCTGGQIKAHSDHNKIIVTNFKTGKTREVDITATGGHGGGDHGIMHAFCAYLRGEDVPGISEINVSVLSHRACFAAEESRQDNGRVIEL